MLQCPVFVKNDELCNLYFIFNVIIVFECLKKAIKLFCYSGVWDFNVIITVHFQWPVCHLMLWCHLILSIFHLIIFWCIYLWANICRVRHPCAFVVDDNSAFMTYDCLQSLPYKYSHFVQYCCWGSQHTEAPLCNLSLSLSLVLCAFFTFLIFK